MKTSTSTAVRCRDCGAEIDEQAKFCIYCGKRQHRGSTWIERKARRKPILVELIGFIVFGAIVCAILWSMYGNLGVRRHEPPRASSLSEAPAPRRTLLTPAPSSIPAPAPISAQTPTPSKPQAAQPKPAVPANANTTQSPDGHATVRVFKSTGTQVPAHPGDQVTYHAGGRHWNVVSGYDGDKIFYQKTIISGDHTSTFLMEYPRSEKAKYQRTNEKLAHSFHGAH